MESKTALILDDYVATKPVFDAMCINVRRLVEELLKIEGIRVASIDGRVKGHDSLAEKLVRPGKEYSKLADVTDVVGVRVVTFFEDDVDRVARVIDREFKLIPEHCNDRRKSEPDRFGYKSLHYVCELSEARQNLLENGSFRGRPIEVQIRSLLQHAWAEIEHDLGYKGAVVLPPDIKRQLSRVAGLLEIADRDFREVRDSSRVYQARVSQELRTNDADAVQLDTISYSEFVENSPLVREFDDFVRSELDHTLIIDQRPDTNIGMLLDVGVHTIGELKRLLSDRIESIKRYCRLILTDSSPADRYIAKASCMFYLAQFLAVEQGGVKKLVRVHKNNGIGSAFGDIEKGVRELIPMMLEAGVVSADK